MTKEKGCVSIHNGRKVCGKEKCLHCLEHRAPTTWYSYCGLYLQPETCGNNFREGWTPDFIQIKRE